MSLCTDKIVFGETVMFLSDANRACRAIGF